MFESKEAEQVSLKRVEESIQTFNVKYGVTASVDGFKNAIDKKSANKIFLDTFKNLLRQAASNASSKQNVDISFMRSDFELRVVNPYREHYVKKADEKDVGGVRNTHPDVNAGLQPAEWLDWVEKSLDEIYWEKVDQIASNYQSRSLRIRDMVAETERIMQGDVSRDDAKRIACYAASLRRTNESRKGIWKLIYYFRGKAELREAANMESRLNERLGENTYQSVLKEIVDPTGRIQSLKREVATKKSIGLQAAISAVKEVQAKKEIKYSKPAIEKEREPIVVDDVKKVDDVPQNSRSNSLARNEKLATEIKNEIWSVLKLKESVTLDKKTVSGQIYDTLLDTVNTINEGYENCINSGANDAAIHELLGDNANTMFTMAYFSIESLNLRADARIIVAQKIADIMLNKLTVIGSEKDKLGKYGEAYAVKNEKAVSDALEMDGSISENVRESLVESSKKTFEKERVKISSESDSRKGISYFAKSDSQPTRGITFKR